ncbi:MAG TPA: YchJ family metal-binding protein, partial [Xanthomonadales bacterium]|nr:YchJ family metal-binding protein [Xanthomonadales bacterium]
MTNPAADPCPCGSQLPYRDCCGHYHAGVAAPDALALMRSRYSAYVLGDRDYLLRTWHASTRPEGLDLGLVGAIRWLGLTVRQHQVIDADHAQV